MPPHPLEVAFTQEAEDLLREYEQRLVNAIKKETGTGLEAMYNRSREIAMRLSLIIARSMGQDEISADAMQWSIDYVNHYAIQTIEMFRSNMSEGPFEAACKAVYARIEKAGLTGLTERELARSVSALQIWIGADVLTFLMHCKLTEVLSVEIKTKVQRVGQGLLTSHHQ